MYKLDSAEFVSLTVLKAGIKIVVSENDAIENVVKKFKKSCYKAGFLQELRHKQRWETAAENKKRKTAHHT